MICWWYRLRPTIDIQDAVLCPRATNNLFTTMTCVKETQSNQACVRISFQKSDSTNWISILRECHISSERFLICSTNGQISCSFYCNKHKHSRNLPYESSASSEKRVCFCSLFCSVEKPSYAHSDQLLHCEPVLCRYPGLHYLPSCQSRSGHHRNMVLWRYTLSNLTLFTGK